MKKVIFLWYLAITLGTGLVYSAGGFVWGTEAAGALVAMAIIFGIVFLPHSLRSE